MKRQLAPFWRVVIGAALVVAVLDVLAGHFLLAVSSLITGYLLWRIGDQEREIADLLADLQRCQSRYYDALTRRGR